MGSTCHSLVSRRQWLHTVNANPTERLFKRWYGPEWSYTNALIRFPHNSADVTRSTVIGYLSSYIGQVKMGQYSLEVLLTPKCSVIEESWVRLTTAFLYSSCTTIWHFIFILHSRIWSSPLMTFSIGNNLSVRRRNSLHYHVLSHSQ
jgi:hypothetical protein